MYKCFSHIDELMDEVRTDKWCNGALSTTLDRYPVRFVLFDNFRDSREFVATMQTEMGCLVKNVNDWLDVDYDDRMMTHSKLAKQIEAFMDAKMVSTIVKDYVIAPFSELARFYDNKDKTEFDALVKTIKGKESRYLEKQSRYLGFRLYIPIVGLEGKMSQFHNDSQIFIWYLKSGDKQLDYRLIMTNNTIYGVNGLEEQYSVVNNVRQWVELWRNENAKSKIISTSSSLFANADYAQPDNAFAFTVCHDVYQFLTDGLGLNLNDVEYDSSEEKHWLRLAQEISINDFSFEKFFNAYFHIDNLADYKVFLKTWFDCKDEFEKWLLSKYYVHKFCNQGYICQALKASNSYTNSDFFAAVALTILGIENKETCIEERGVCLKLAAEHGVKLSDENQNELCELLRQFATKDGHATAIRYFSPLTEGEKKLALEWLSLDVITVDEIKDFFPDLYHYLSPSVGTSQQWILDYIDCYKLSKVHNKYTKEVQDVINEKNASVVAFNSWCQDFKTVKTILHNRADIDVYYWIDGLGIDWIPYIQWLVSLKKDEGIYLNEIHVGCAHYPTTTSNNKQDLMDLSNNTLKKIGDLDAHAHKNTNQFPDFVLEELDIVKKAIHKIISEYNGKKIAIVSDHGLTALSQYCDGMNMAGVESDHHGRIAIRTDGKCVSGNEYVICDDGRTMCALQHKSLCAKVPEGQSIHGGCTPEELLIPIIVISSKENSSDWTATLQTKTISESDPIVRYVFKGDTTNLYPRIVYNGKQYALKRINDTLFESDRLTLDKDATTIKLVVGDIEQKDSIVVNLGATEDDLFDFDL